MDSAATAEGFGLMRAREVPVSIRFEQEQEIAAALQKSVRILQEPCADDTYVVVLLFSDICWPNHTGWSRFVRMVYQVLANLEEKNIINSQEETYHFNEIKKPGRPFHLRITRHRVAVSPLAEYVF